MMLGVMLFDQTSWDALQMSKADFLRNNRGIDDGKDIPEVFMGALYDRIVKNEIKMKGEPTIVQNKQPSANKILGLDAILNIVIRKRGEEKATETSDDIIRHMQEQFKAKAGKSEYVRKSFVFGDAILSICINTIS